ncbi:MAG: cytochrome c biogenesis protein CcdA, partial [Angelakisella sp.]
MNLSLETSLPAAAVFLQGLFSFFSPCVLPLVPLYIGYLAGGTGVADENGVVHYPRKKVLLNTLCFVIGVSFAFFLLGFGFTAAGRFFGSNRNLFARIGGIIVILFGVYQLGILGSSRLIQEERRLPFRLQNLAMNPLVALVMGFTFSFAWT